MAMLEVLNVRNLVIKAESKYAQQSRQRNTNNNPIFIPRETGNPGGHTFKYKDRLAWFKHDTGHFNMAFIEMDGFVLMEFVQLVNLVWSGCDRENIDEMGPKCTLDEFYYLPFPIRLYSG